MDLRKLKKLIDLVQESGIAELEITEGEEKVKIVKGGAVVNMPAPVLAAPTEARPASLAAPTAASPQFNGNESVKTTRKSLDRTDAELNARWSLRRGDQEMFSLPRAQAFRTFVLYHIVHHRGQLSVYLRLNNVPVPAIYGPTADEG